MTPSLLGIDSEKPVPFSTARTYIVAAAGVGTALGAGWGTLLGTGIGTWEGAGFGTALGAVVGASVHTSSR